MKDQKLAEASHLLTALDAELTGPTANPYVGATTPLAPAAPAALEPADTGAASADAASAGLRSDS